jgi:hypothetical protein
MTVTVAALCMSAMTGCFVSHKETVREVPVAPATVESSKTTTVETVPPASEVQTHTTVEKY